jgi:hypothetical protein
MEITIGKDPQHDIHTVVAHIHYRTSLEVMQFDELLGNSVYYCYGLLKEQEIMVICQNH